MIPSHASRKFCLTKTVAGRKSYCDSVFSDLEAPVLKLPVAACLLAVNGPGNPWIDSLSGRRWPRQLHMMLDSEFTGGPGLGPGRARRGPRLLWRHPASNRAVVAVTARRPTMLPLRCLRPHRLFADFPCLPNTTFSLHFSAQSPRCPTLIPCIYIPFLASS